MASFFDSNFTSDGGGPDTDPVPDSDDLFSSENGEPDDINNTPEPGEGDSFSGKDPSFFSGEGNPDEPESQKDTTPPVQIDEQSADTPDGGLSYGRKDDPDTQENKSDEQYSDKEDDDSNVEDIFYSPETDTIEEINPDDYVDEIETNIFNYKRYESKIDSNIEDFIMETFDDIFEELINDSNLFLETENDSFQTLINLDPNIDENTTILDFEMNNLDEEEDIIYSELEFLNQNQYLEDFFVEEDTYE